MRTMLLAGAMVLGLGFGGAALAGSPVGIQFQEAPAGGAEAKPAEGEVKKANPLDDKSPWKQPKIKELPENDEAAVKSLKKAMGSVYSARGAGMGRFAGKFTMSMKMDMGANAPEGMPPMAFDFKFNSAWVKGKDAVMSIVEDEDDGDPMAGMIRGQMTSDTRQMSQSLDMMIGFDEFETAHKEKRVVYETPKDGEVEVIRVWEKDETGFISRLFYVSGGELKRIRDKESDSKLEYTKVGRDKFISKMVVRPDGAGRQGMGPGAPETIDLVFATREKIGDYHFTTKVTMVMDMGMMKMDMSFGLSDVKVDSDVTDAMVKAAGGTSADEAGEGVAEDGDKPAPGAPAAPAAPAKAPAAPAKAPADAPKKAAPAVPAGK